MKKIKNLTAVVLAFCIMLSFSGCSIIYSFLDAEAVAEAEAIPKVGFSHEELSNEAEEIIMSGEELYAIDRVADDYRSDFHFSLLSEEEKLAYTALEYALEMGYRYVYFDYLLVPSDEYVEKLIDYLALDSPLLEQNLSYQIGTFTTYYNVKHSYATLDGVYMDVKNFTAEAFSKKLEAIEAAKKVIAEMPQGLGEVEKAEYLHNYTVSNVVYTDYVDGYKVGEDVGVYDGLVNGKTHCDGSNNMLALLFNMAGLKSFEKVFTSEEVEGHTWNTVMLNGEWYNCDGTALREDNRENMDIYRRRHFAYEDVMQSHIPDYADIYPACQNGIGIKVNAKLESLDKKTFVNTVRDAFKTNGERIALLLVDNYSDSDADNLAQRLANSLSREISWYEYKVINGKTAMLIVS